MGLDDALARTQSKLWWSKAAALEQRFTSWLRKAEAGLRAQATAIVGEAMKPRDWPAPIIPSRYLAGPNPAAFTMRFD